MAVTILSFKKGDDVSDHPQQKIIPPLSVVKLDSDVLGWRNQRGRIFRIGYYGKQDGLDCVWLVNDAGEYEQATDQKSISDDFQILELSDEKDLFGIGRPVIGPRKS